MGVPAVLVWLGTLLCSIFPEKYWLNFCKLTQGIQLLYQLNISVDHLKEGHKLLCEFHQGFKDLYVQHLPEQIHFLHYSIHLLIHIAPKTICVRPLICYSQWTMETTIGNLGEEICQDHNPYANIIQRGLLHAQTNSPLAIMLDVLIPGDKFMTLPHGSKDLGGGYVLLQVCQPTAMHIGNHTNFHTMTGSWIQLLLHTSAQQGKHLLTTPHYKIHPSMDWDLIWSMLRDKALWS